MVDYTECFWLSGGTTFKLYPSDLSVASSYSAGAIGLRFDRAGSGWIDGTGGSLYKTDRPFTAGSAQFAVSTGNRALGMDRKESLWVASEFSVIRYDQSGSQTGGFLYGNEGGDEALDVEVDEYGSLFITGGYNTVGVSKYTVSGSFEQLYRTDCERLEAISFDKDGCIWAVPYFETDSILIHSVESSSLSVITTKITPSITSYWDTNAFDETRAFTPTAPLEEVNFGVTKYQGERQMVGTPGQPDRTSYVTMSEVEGGIEAVAAKQIGVGNPEAVGMVDNLAVSASYGGPSIFYTQGENSVRKMDAYGSTLNAFSVQAASEAGGMVINYYGSYGITISGGFDAPCLYVTDNTGSVVKSSVTSTVGPTEGRGMGFSAFVPLSYVTTKINRMEYYVGMGIDYTLITPALMDPAGEGSTYSAFNPPDGDNWGVQEDAASSLWISHEAGQSLYLFNRSTRTVVSSFPTTTDPYDLSIDASGCIWVAGGTSGSVYKYDNTITAVASYNAGVPTVWGVTTNNERDLL